MENMVKSILSLADDNFSKPVPGTHRLGIHFTASYIALLVIKIEEAKIVAFQVFEPQEQFPEFDNLSIRKILDYFIASHEWFSDTSLITSVLVPGNAFTLVPEELYSSFNKEQLLDPHYQVQSSDIVFAEKLVSIPAIALYALSWNWSQQLRAHFTDVKLLHEDVCWINLAISAQGKNLPNSSAILYLENSKIKIQLIKGGNLLYFNSFYSVENQDVLYYLHLAMTQAGLSPMATDVFLAGPASDNPSLEVFLKQYTSSVNQLTFPFFKTIPSSMRKNYPKLYLALFSLVTCG